MDIELPTLAVALKMHMDCEQDQLPLRCAGLGASLRHDLVVCHQVIDEDQGIYQAVIRHGETEAVLVVPTGTEGLRRVNNEVVDWIDRVHAYEAAGLERHP